MTDKKQLRRLPDQISIDHGPAELLARFFLEADREARDRGLYLTIRPDFDELVALNEREREHWYRIATMFNPDYSDLRLDNSFWIEGRTAEGKVVVAQAARFHRWADTDLKRELEGLRIFYADPSPYAGAGGSCVVTAPSAPAIKGRVVYSGSTWFHPTFRGLGLSAILPRISRAYALTRWNSDYTISFVEQKLITRGVVRSYGYTNVETTIEVRKIFQDDLEMGLIWMDRAELLTDLEVWTLDRRSNRAEHGGTRQKAAAVG